MPLRTEDYILAIWSNPLLSVTLVWFTLFREQEYMALAHTLTFLAPAAVNENMEALPLVTFIGAALVIEYVAPQPADFVLLFRVIALGLSVSSMTLVFVFEYSLSRRAFLFAHSLSFLVLSFLNREEGQ